MAAKDSATRLDSLTGLRWWAAFGVFAFHMGVLAPLPFQDYLHIGHTGVSFFFILSGFVLTWSARPHVSAGEFWWRRFSRIWPAHMVALFLAIPVFYSLAEPDPAHTWIKTFSWGIIALSVVLAQGFSTNPVIIFSGNPAAWTLSCEAFFYALHPFISPRREVSRYFIWTLFGVSIVTGFVVHLFDAVSVLIPPPVARSWEFLLGISAAYAVKSGLRIRMPMNAILVLLVGAVVGYHWLNSTPLRETSTVIAGLSDVLHVLLSLLYVLIICAVSTLDIERSPSWLRASPMVKLGEWSYAFYLVHATIFYAVLPQSGRLEWNPIFTPFVWAGCLLLALLAAVSLHIWVEKPLENHLRQWGKRRLFTKTS